MKIRRGVDSSRRKKKRNKNWIWKFIFDINSSIPLVMIHVIRFTCEQTGSTSKEESLSLAVDTPFPLTELFNFKAQTLRSEKLQRARGTALEDRSMGGRRNEPSKPVFSPFVRLKDIFACERSTITRWKNVDGFDVNTTVVTKSLATAAMLTVIKRKPKERLRNATIGFSTGNQRLRKWRA